MNIGDAARSLHVTTPRIKQWIRDGWLRTDGADITPEDLEAAVETAARRTTIKPVGLALQQRRLRRWTAQHGNILLEPPRATIPGYSEPSSAWQFDMDGAA